MKTDLLFPVDALHRSFLSGRIGLGNAPDAAYERQPITLFLR